MDKFPLNDGVLIHSVPVDFTQQENWEFVGLYTIQTKHQFKTI